MTVKRRIYVIDRYEVHSSIFQIFSAESIISFKEVQNSNLIQIRSSDFTAFVVAFQQLRQSSMEEIQNEGGQDPCHNCPHLHKIFKTIAIDLLFQFLEEIKSQVAKSGLWRAWVTMPSISLRSNLQSTLGINFSHVQILRNNDVYICHINLKVYTYCLYRQTIDFIQKIEIFLD